MKRARKQSEFEVTSKRLLQYLIVFYQTLGQSELIVIVIMNLHVILILTTAFVGLRGHGGSSTHSKQRDWPGLCVIGKRQSPLNLENPVYDFDLEPLQFAGYDRPLTSAGRVTILGCLFITILDCRSWQKRVNSLVTEFPDGTFCLKVWLFH